MACRVQFILPCAGTGLVLHSRIQPGLQHCIANVLLESAMVEDSEGTFRTFDKLRQDYRLKWCCMPGLHNSMTLSSTLK